MRASIRIQLLATGKLLTTIQKQSPKFMLNWNLYCAHLTLSTLHYVIHIYYKLIDHSVIYKLSLKKASVQKMKWHVVGNLLDLNLFPFKANIMLFLYKYILQTRLIKRERVVQNPNSKRVGMLCKIWMKVEYSDLQVFQPKVDI